MGEESAVIKQEELHVEPAPHEDAARQQGWKPQEEWEGSPEEWVDAKEFNRRGEYMDRIKTQSSLIKKLEKKLSTVEMTMQELSEHHRKVRETERTRALDELKSMKVQALDVGDHTKVTEIDDQILDIKSQSKEDVKKPQPKAVDPALESWMEENPWYETDVILRGAANGIVEDLVKKTPSLQGNVEELLSLATDQLKEAFPQKFGKRKSAVIDTAGNDGVNNSSSRTPKYNARHLNEEQRRVADRFVKQGAVKSLEEYARQLADIGELDIQKGA